MEQTLIRMLSTGRTGTKFIAAVFADQGYPAFHENLYEGEPSSAIIQYTRMLGDMWMEDKNKYYSFESDFARPYLTAVLDNLDFDQDAPPSSWKRLFQHQNFKGSTPVVVHTGHRLTSATPIIEREAYRRGVSVKTLILFRNPLKTIHAIYTVESPSSAWGGPYHNWPASFYEDGTYLGAADIWANTYSMAHDQSMRLAGGNYRVLNLEKIKSEAAYLREIFTFLNLPFQEERFKTFLQTIADQPLRSSKTHDTRNSDLFHDPNFYFSDRQIAEIYERIVKLLPLYDLDWARVAHEYTTFHEQEKREIGFA